jgi:phage shock protein A
MDKTNLIIALIEIIVAFIPIGTLIWRVSKVVSHVEEHEKRIMQTENKIIDLDRNTDMSLSAIMASLNEIKVSIGKLETKIDMLEKKENSYEATK